MINVTQHDPVYGWEAVQPKRHSPAMVAYLEARAEAEAAWRLYTELVDTLIAVGNYEAIEREAENCEELDRKARLLYKQANCPHNAVEWSGSARIGYGGYEDDYRPVCIDCGAEVFEQGESSGFNDIPL